MYKWHNSLLFSLQAICGGFPIGNIADGKNCLWFIDYLDYIQPLYGKYNQLVALLEHQQQVPSEDYSLFFAVAPLLLEILVQENEMSASRIRYFVRIQFEQH